LSEGTTAWATGWGATYEGGYMTPDMMQVAMPMLSDSDCKAKYSSIKPAAQMYFFLYLNKCSAIAMFD
jgi:hypothetical protein